MGSASAKPSNVTLLLGAWASMPYGFPSGEGLIREIVKYAKALSVQHGYDEQRTTQDTEIRIIRGALPAIGEKTRVIAERLHRELQLYQPRSIDTYLGNLYALHVFANRTSTTQKLFAKEVDLVRMVLDAAANRDA